jgi:predicted lactoylglutathione lyase
MCINEVVPFLAVKDIQKSLAFYINGLGCEVKNEWKDEGELRWCRLQIDDVGLMLQQFKTEGHDSRQFSDNKGEGVSLCFFCQDAVEFYWHIKSRGINASEPVVGNGLWVTSVKDPDGYQLVFESATDIPEGTRLSDIENAAK